MAFKLERLKSIQILSEFTKHFVANEILFHQGQIGNTLFVILEGRVHLLLDAPSGEHVFSVVAPGDILGEKALLQEKGHQRIFSAQAVEPVSAVELSLQDLIRIQKHDPNLILDILKRSFEVSAKRLELANYLARVLRGTDSKKRFCECIIYVAHVAGSPVSTGIKIPTLKEALNYFLELNVDDRDRWLTELVHSGALETQDQDFVLVNQQKLMASCIPTGQ